MRNQTRDSRAGAAKEWEMTRLELFGIVTVFSTVGIVLISFILYAILHRKRHYRCPSCGKRFKTSAASTFFAARDGVDKRMVCPYCGHFGYMEDHRDDEAPEDGKVPDGGGDDEEPGRRE